MKIAPIAKATAASVFLLGIAVALTLWALGGYTLASIVRDLTLVAFSPIAAVWLVRSPGKQLPGFLLLGFIVVGALGHLWIVVGPAEPSSLFEVSVGRHGPAIRSQHEVGRATNAAAWFSRIPESELMNIGSEIGLTRSEFETFASTEALENLGPRTRTSNLVLGDWLNRPARYQLLRPMGDGPFPVVVFLHGHGGLFEAYSRVLEPLATDHGIAVLLPAFGFGHWDQPEAAEHLRSIVEDARTKAPLTSDPWTLAGLSAGGHGAWTLAATAVGRLGFDIRHLAVISAPIPTSERPSVPITWIAGTGDERIGIESVRSALEPFERDPQPVTLHELEATHLLVLEQGEAVIATLVEATQAR
ncbi:MAG: hypothetical protein AAF196_20085 [Planctomycetota bacterium]